MLSCQDYWLGLVIVRMARHVVICQDYGLRLVLRHEMLF